MVTKGPLDETKVNLDENDRAILRLVVRDPRTPIADIAREVGVQRDTVLYRIKRFEKRGLIVKYHAILEPQALGLNIFMMVLIKLAPVDKDALKDFLEKLVKHKNITHVSRLVGRYDYFLQIAAEDIMSLDVVLDEIKAIRQGLIVDMDISNVIDGLKTDDFSGLI
jgi:Lrp/AsnC family transcriptional regulator, leucine-responsive regulatory protein